MLGVELFEDVSGELDVAFDSMDDLLALFVRCALHEVRDLGRMQPPQALQRHQQLRGRNVSDERLDVLPVQDGVPSQVRARAAWDQPPQHRARAAVDAKKPPSVVDAS